MHKQLVLFLCPHMSKLPLSAHSSHMDPQSSCAISLSQDSYQILRDTAGFPNHLSRLLPLLNVASLGGRQPCKIRFPKAGCDIDCVVGAKSQ